MENLIELWYLNSAAIFVPVLVLAVVAYIWYDSNQKRIPAANWLAGGILCLALTLPAAYTAFNLDKTEKELLRTYLDRVRVSQQLLGEDVAKILETLAKEMGLTQVGPINYDNLTLFIYLSLGGLVGSIVITGLYYRSASAPAIPSPGPYQATYQMPPTQAPFGGNLPPTMPPGGGTVTVPPPSVSSYVGKSAPPPLERTKLMNEPAKVVAWLVARDGSRQGKSYPIGEGESLIGRDGRNCSVVLEHESVSSQHAKIRLEQNTFWLYDLASTNGTFLNNHRIQRQRLEDGDEIRLGAVAFSFKEVR